MARGCLDTFRAASPESAILVTTTLRGGRQFFAYGMHMHVSAEVPGILMLQDDSAYPSRGLVARDGDILSVEFEIMDAGGDESQPVPFGFHRKPEA